MKTVLFPTDFSLNSIHAIRYALSLFKTKDVRYILFNAYSYPTAGTTFIDDLQSEFDMLSDLKLNRLLEQLKENYGHTDLIMELISEFGFLPNSLIPIIDKYDVDLVVMGSSGESGFNLSLFGSKAYETMKSLKCPVLTVPLQSPLDSPKHIGVATEEIMEGWESVLNPIFEIAQLNESIVHGISIKKPKEELVPAAEESSPNKKIDYYQIENPDTLMGIKSILGEHGIDMLVLLRKERDFFQSLFHKSLSKQISSKITVPILTINAVD